MKTTFVLVQIPKPRISKRIEIARQFGEVSLICPRRNQNDWASPFSDVAYHILDVNLPPTRRLIQRWWESQKYQNTVLSLLRGENPDVLHVEGLDSLMIAVKYCKQARKKIRLIYEVADLREPFIADPHNPIEWLLYKVISFLDFRCVKYVDWLIVTSPKFYDMRYAKVVPQERVVCLLNIPDSAPFQHFRKKTTGPFTVGFIGGLRYLEQMKLLVDAAERAGCHVLFAGAGAVEADIQSFQQYCKDKDFVEFTGKYNFHREIASIYGKVDCVYSVYNADNPNVRIALPNKLYEAVLCHLPIIVAKNTYLASTVESWGCGVAVDHKSVSELASVLKKFSTDSVFYQSFCNNCDDLPFSMDDNREQLTDIYEKLYKDINTTQA